MLPEQRIRPKFFRSKRVYLWWYQEKPSCVTYLTTIGTIPNKHFVKYDAAHLLAKHTRPS